MTLIKGQDKLILRFDGKPSEMQGVGTMWRPVLNQMPAMPLKFDKTRPEVTA